MSLTLTAEPEIIDGARSYAARSGMTLEPYFADVCLTYPMSATAHRIAQNRARMTRGASARGCNTPPPPCSDAL